MNCSLVVGKSTDRSPVTASFCTTLFWSSFMKSNPSLVKHVLDDVFLLQPCMQITKQQVNEFTPGQRIPCCQVQVKLEKDKKPVELEHKVKLLGAKKDFNFFTITCTPDGMSHNCKVLNEFRALWGQACMMEWVASLPVSNDAWTLAQHPCGVCNCPNLSQVWIIHK